MKLPALTSLPPLSSKSLGSVKSAEVVKVTLPSLNPVAFPKSLEPPKNIVPLAASKVTSKSPGKGPKIVLPSLNPVASVTPVTSVAPITSVASVTPVTPVAPVTSVAPITPITPVTPVPVPIKISSLPSPLKSVNKTSEVSKAIQEVGVPKPLIVSAVPFVPSCPLPSQQLPKNVPDTSKTIVVRTSKETTAGEVSTMGEKDPRKHIETFFGTRHGIQGNPVENVNYDLESLTYMTSHNRADQITEAIIKKMKNLNNMIPFSLYECCSGIGGNTLSFLDNVFGANPSISFVTTHECDVRRRDMFRKNAEMYRFNDSSKLKISDEPFTGVPRNLNNVVLFIDPPWLKADTKGHQSTKDDYMLSGIKLAGKSLEEWVAQTTNAVLVVFRLPPGYKLNNIPGYKIDSELLKNSLLIYAYPDLKAKENLLESQAVAKEKQIKEENVIWRENLKNFLRYELLPRATTNPTVLDRLVDDEAMKTWMTVFTSETYNPTISENYEELELLGDRLLGALYTRFMMESYPSITRSQMSEFINRYLAKSFQAQLSGSLGVGKHIRSRMKNTTHMLEDVLEAIFGGIWITGDLIKQGAGAGLAYNLLVSLYENVEVDWSITLGNPKTRVKEIFEAMNWIDPKLQQKVPEEVNEDGKGNVIFSVLFNSIAMNQLRAFGISVTSQIVATAIESTKKKASDAAYVLAVRNLENMGITKEWVSQLRETRERENPELVPYIAAIQPRLEKEGFVKFQLTDYHVKGKPGANSVTGKFVQLIGEDAAGGKKVLAMTPESVESAIVGRQIVLSDYARYEQ